MSGEARRQATSCPLPDRSRCASGPTHLRAFKAVGVAGPGAVVRRSQRTGLHGCRASRIPRSIASRSVPRTQPVRALAAEQPDLRPRRDGRRPCHPRGHRRPTPSGLFDERGGAGWSTETDPTSLAAFDVRRGTTAPEITFRFGLATGDTKHQFAAMGVVTPDGIEPFDRLTFEARAESRCASRSSCARPSIPDYQERWERSVYLEPTDRQISVFFDDMTPIGATQTFRPPRSAVRSIVFAVDRTNTAAGTSGRIVLLGMCAWSGKSGSGPDGENHVGSEGAEHHVRRPRRQDRRQDPPLPIATNTLMTMK